MPSVSKKQHRAMEAAAHGHSNIGIPKKVGKEFVSADKKKSSRTMTRTGKGPGGGSAPVGHGPSVKTVLY